MSVLDAFNLYKKSLVQSTVDPEKYNGEHIIETLFLRNFYIPIKDIFIPIWKNYKF
jgi:hypothetical protein